MSRQHNNRFHHTSHPSRGWLSPQEQEFKCVQCGQYVSCAPILAGVQNRNHCPACLWSRHLDWRSPGDRLSTCRAAMRPVGLTTKRGRNKYARERDGELMIVHRCTDCEAFVINRVAADDSAAAIFEVFEGSLAGSDTLQTALAISGVSVLTAQDSDLVRRRLLGNGYPAAGRDWAEDMQAAA